jgi:hypothetical protein
MIIGPIFLPLLTLVSSSEISCEEILNQLVRLETGEDLTIPSIRDIYSYSMQFSDRRCNELELQLANIYVFRNGIHLKRLLDLDRNTLSDSFLQRLDIISKLVETKPDPVHIKTTAHAANQEQTNSTPIYRMTDLECDAVLSTLINLEKLGDRSDLLVTGLLFKTQCDQYRKYSIEFQIFDLFLLYTEIGFNQFLSNYQEELSEDMKERVNKLHQANQVKLEESAALDSDQPDTAKSCIINLNSEKQTPELPSTYEQGNEIESRQRQGSRNQFELVQDPSKKSVRGNVRNNWKCWNCSDAV